MFNLLIPLLEPLPQAAAPENINQYLAAAFPLFIGLTAAIAVLMFAWGGLEYMLSGVPGAKGEGKERMKLAIYGLILALAAWLILNEINPDILRTTLNPR